VTSIDSSAQVAKGAALGDDVAIGPFCVVGPNVTLGDGCRLISHVHVSGHTEIGARTSIFPFASLGTPPQSVHYAGEPTRLLIGSDNIIREGVTMNTGTIKGGGVTRVGDRGFFMAQSHVAHDATVGNDVTLANSVALGGHANVGDFVFIGGLSAVHQFVRIGAYVMVAGVTGVAHDVVPFAFVQGSLANLVGMNVVGMKRRGFSRADMHRVRGVYRTLFEGEGTFIERRQTVIRDFADDPVIGQIVAFIQAGGDRQLMRPKPHRGEAERAPS
jgi:UDP-N-acetylglucosamine acyltransferase